MRTTLTLDDDVAGLLRKEVRRSEISFRQAVNQYLRLGLMAAQRGNRRPFAVTPLPLGLPSGLCYDNVEELLESLEGGTYK